VARYRASGRVGSDDFVFTYPPYTYRECLQINPDESKLESSIRLPDQVHSGKRQNTGEVRREV
jgi:hypothetical protein